MLDPVPAPLLLRQAASPLADYLHLRTLPLHVHEIVLGFAFFSLVDSVISPYFCSLFLNPLYSKFSTRDRLNWDIHVTSFVHSIFITSAVIWVLVSDTDRLSSDWQERLWNYTGTAGMVQGFTMGYFLWDLKVCVFNYGMLGIFDLIHSFSATLAAVIGFRPFALYYGMQYLLFELSTPFANMHWFFNKSGLAGSKAQMYNGLCLITTFFFCRLVWGSYLSVTLYGDIWTALHTPEPVLTEIVFSTDDKPLQLANTMPYWYAAIFLFSNVGLMSLNIFWFTKMVQTIRGHLRSQEKQQDGQDTYSGRSPAAKVAAGGVASGDARRRKR